MVGKVGDEKRGGRQRGTPNKVTSKAKDALMEAFNQLGDVPALVRWAKRNKSDFYKLWVRVLPQEVHGKGFLPPPPPKGKQESDAEFARRVAFVLAAGVADLKKADIIKQAFIESQTTH